MHHIDVVVEKRVEYDSLESILRVYSHRTMPGTMNEVIEHYTKIIYPTRLDLKPRKIQQTDGLVLVDGKPINVGVVGFMFKMIHQY